MLHPLPLTLWPSRALGEEEGGVAARLAGWQGRRAAFLGIVWGKCIVRVSLLQAARADTGLWGMPLAAPSAVSGGGSWALGQVMGWLGTFQEILP